MSHTGTTYTPLDFWQDLSTNKQRLQTAGEVAQTYQFFNSKYAVASTSATTPIVVTTVGNNPFETGDKVFVTGTGDGNADALTPWTITRLTGTTFSLSTSMTGGGSSGAGFCYEAGAGNVAVLINNVSLIGARLGFASGDTSTDSLLVPVAARFQSSFSLDSTLGAQFLGANPVKTADPGTDNIAIGLNQSKAWAHLTIGNNVFTYDDGMNIASIAVNSGDHHLLDVAFARAMANATYGVTFGWELDSGIPIMVNGSQTTAGFQIAVVKTSNFSQKWDLVSESQITPLSFTVMARQ